MLLVSRIYLIHDKATAHHRLTEREEERMAVGNSCGYLSCCCEKILGKNNLRRSLFWLSLSLLDNGGMLVWSPGNTPIVFKYRLDSLLPFSLDRMDAVHRYFYLSLSEIRLFFFFFF